MMGGGVRHDGCLGSPQLRLLLFDGVTGVSRIIMGGKESKTAAATAGHARQQAVVLIF